VTPPAIRLPAAIITLTDEHRYMKLLVKTLDERLASNDEPTVGDYFLMQDIVRYMHEYSDKVHHPTEDLMFEKLLQRNPAREKDVARLQREHGFLDRDTSKLMELLEIGAERQTPEYAKAVRDTAGKYIYRIRQHMQFEENELFPSATQCLASKDWHDIEARLEAAEDPLFGRTVQRDYRVLYEYFADRSGQLSRKVTNFGFLRLDSMIVSADAIEKGIAEMWQMLQERGTTLERECRKVTEDSVNSAGIAARIAQQAKYAGAIGKAALATGSGATGIYLRTLRNAAVSFFKGAQ
jgi:hemerythrin-like domain-containing protein